MKFSMQDFLTDFEEEINEIFEDIEDIEGDKVDRNLIISVVSEVLEEEGLSDITEYDALGFIERVASNRYKARRTVKTLKKDMLKDNLRMHVEVSR